MRRAQMLDFFGPFLLLRTLEESQEVDGVSRYRAPSPCPSGSDRSVHSNDQGLQEYARDAARNTQVPKCVGSTILKNILCARAGSDLVPTVPAPMAPLRPEDPPGYSPASPPPPESLHISPTQS